MSRPPDVSVVIPSYGTRDATLACLESLARQDLAGGFETLVVDNASPDDTADRVRRQFPDVEPVWHYGYLFSPALTLGGGTFAVQRNIVGEFVLGLPREPNLEQGLSWSEARQQRT